MTVALSAAAPVGDPERRLGLSELYRVCSLMAFPVCGLILYTARLVQIPKVPGHCFRHAANNRHRN